MEWIADPTAWLGLGTLIVLEIVLGIDNLLFIALLADRLPPRLRDRARQLGLALALIMRLGLLASVSWLMGFTAPLFSLFAHEFSGRDLILFAGGVFLLCKATLELHERLEGGAKRPVTAASIHAGIGAVIAQILVLDAVFSLDAVIAAVGMVDDLAMMMIAITVAMVTMMIASKPLTTFVNNHPTVVILCLGFLLVIGFSLVAESAGFEIPKGYLYGAIAFSVLIESCNQLALFNRQRNLDSSSSLRERAAEAMLKLLGSREEAEGGKSTSVLASEARAPEPFDHREQSMIRSVLLLGQRPIQSLMTPRPDIVWVDLHASKQELLTTLLQSGHSRLVVAEGELDNFVGVVQSRDMLAAALADSPVDLASLAKDPLIVPEGTRSLKLMDQLREHIMPMAIVVDEYGSIEGVITTSDLLAAIAGELADTIDPDAPLSVRQEDGSWLLDGGLPLDQMEHLLQLKLPNSDGFYTLAGLAMTHLQHLPEPGEYFELEGYGFTILSLEGRRILQVEVKRVAPPMEDEDG